MNGLSFGPVELAVAAGLVLANAGASLVWHLGYHRSLIVAALRMVLQLVLVGFVLRFVFNSPNPLISLAVIVVMLSAATIEVGARQKARLAGPWHFAVAGIAVSGATTLVCAFALATVAGRTDWTSAATIVPIFGIVLGSAMNAASIGLNTIFDGVSTDRSGIEAQLALGRSRKEAMATSVGRAVHAGTIPILNQMAGAGLITLPGIMSGQVLSGVDPLKAAEAQIFLMFLLSAASVASVVVAVHLAFWRLTDQRDRLRLDRLHAHKI